jgi:hypothetical protein
MAQIPKRVVAASHYHELYRSLDLAYRESATSIHPSHFVNEINGPARHALAAFMLTGAIWESLLNFAFFSPWTRIHFGDKAELRCNSLSNELDKLSLLEKTYALPLIAFEQTFNKGTILFQELKALISIRNCIVHDLPDRIPEKEVEFLRTRKCLLHDTPPNYQSDQQPWQTEISTMESIRWCMNLLPKLTDELIKLSGHPGNHLKSFPMITVSIAKKMISVAQYNPNLRSTLNPLGQRQK